MPLAIVTSSDQSQHSTLLTLNIIGVLICLSIEILLVLAAIGVIFAEPDISPVLQAHVDTFMLSCLESGRRSLSVDQCCERLTFEDEYLFQLKLNDTYY